MEKRLMSNHTEVLHQLYSSAQQKLNSSDKIPQPPKHLKAEEIDMLDLVADKSEYFKGATTVLITSLTHKIVDPAQDIRKHQINLEGGYSGRTTDTKYVTPFLKQMRLTHMAESGWLTRSLEQNSPLDLNFNGQIRDKDFKKSFLSLIDNIQTKGASPEDYLDYLFQKLIVLRDAGIIEVTKFQDAGNSISDIMSLLEKHFKQSDGAGRSRLPVLAVYSIYQCIVPQLKRYSGKSLKKLESHTSPDYRSGDIGDIQVNSASEPFEGLEIKCDVKITPQLIDDAYRKFQKYPVDRYYILSTIKPTAAEYVELDKMTDKIAHEHGCQFIADDLLTTIKYYLRLINDPEEFLNNYTVNLAEDEVIKTQHKLLWKQLVEQAL